MYTAEELKLAVAAVKNREVSLQEASNLYNIPKTTLDRKKNKVIVEKLRRGPSTILTKDEEESLVLYIKEAQNRGFPNRGFPRTDDNILDEVGKIVTEDGQPNPFIVGIPLLEQQVTHKLNGNCSKYGTVKLSLMVDQNGNIYLYQNWGGEWTKLGFH